MKEDNIIGTRIGIYDVVCESERRDNDGHKLYHVICSECGWETDMRKDAIVDTKECSHVGLNGKYKSYNTYIWNNKRLGRIFNKMKSRCYNSKSKDYRWYGEKGIKICDEWMNNPKLFEEWAINNGYADNLTIDRINENKNYCPENCQWITIKRNAKYKSTTSLINIDGEIHTGREWADILHLGTNIINTYIRKYGEENTKDFIRKYLRNSGNKPKSKQSYYDLYMNNQDFLSF